MIISTARIIVRNATTYILIVSNSKKSIWRYWKYIWPKKIIQDKVKLSSDYWGTDMHIKPLKPFCYGPPALGDAPSWQLFFLLKIARINGIIGFFFFLIGIVSLSMETCLSNTCSPVFMTWEREGALVNVTYLFFWNSKPSFIIGVSIAISVAFSTNFRSLFFLELPSFYSFQLVELHLSLLKLSSKGGEAVHHLKSFFKSLLEVLICFF